MGVFGGRVLTANLKQEDKDRKGMRLNPGTLQTKSFHTDIDKLR